MLKNLLPLTAIALLLSACEVFRPAVKPADGNASSKATSGDSPQFIENISTTPPAVKNSNLKGQKDERIIFADDGHTPALNIKANFNIEQGITEQFKYAIVMDVEVEKLANANLYRFIDDWWGTPYRIGGNNHKGVDCSSFVQNLLSAIYDVRVPRVAKEQLDGCSRVNKGELREGDLVFFNTRGGVSHVGVYLCNNKFVHASTSGGVMISDLGETYWNNRFTSAGRPRQEEMVSGGR